MINTSNYEKKIPKAERLVKKRIRK